jgi:hypothetical protein
MNVFDSTEPTYFAIYSETQYVILVHLDLAY